MDPRDQRYGHPIDFMQNNPHFQFPKHEGFTKVYLGNLPVDITEQDIKEQFQPFTEVIEIKVIRGNANGQFSRYVFAFMQVKGQEDFVNQVIRKISLNNAGWRINIRADYQKDKGRFEHRDRGVQRYQRQDFKPRDNFRERQHPPSNIPYMQPNFSNRLINYNQGERGIKRHRILVRQIWVGGIPERISEQEMREIMSTFGMVQATQIFSKFAFIKFKLVNDATTAFQKAHIIYDRFGKNPGFRIFFSDPEKRIQIVSNHYQFDRQSEYLPILFLGFPPVTSSFVDDIYMKSVCQQYGPIVETYMRKSNNPQTRSYILLTYDNVKNAIRAKQQLSRRKDLLGDKRVEVAVLLQEDAILRGRNLQITIQRFQTPNNYQKRGKSSTPSYNPHSYQPQMPMYGHHQYPSYQQYPPNQPMMQNNMMMPPMPNIPPMPNMPNMPGMNNMGNMPGMSGMNQGGMMPPPPYYQNMYYPYPMDPPFNNSSETEKEEVIKILQSALKKTTDLPSPKNDIPELQDKEGKNPDWSGFLMRSKIPKVAVDGYSKSSNFNFEESIINISYLIKLSDAKLKLKKSILILQAPNQANQKAFLGYVQYLKKKQSAGVCLSYKQMIFLLPKSAQADEISEITEKQLLVVMQDITLYHELKSLLIKAED